MIDRYVYMGEKGFDFQRSILDSAETYFKNDVAPMAADIDSTCIFPREIINDMGRQGYLGAAIPEEWGGLELDPVFYGELTEIVGKACPATRSLLTVHTSLVCETLLKRGSADQKERYLIDLARGKKIACFALTEPDIGSDATSVKTKYEKKGDVFIINGRKRWITFGDIADVFMVFASDNGKVSAFIVERNMPGVQTKPMTGLLAGKGTHIAEITFNNVEVHKTNMICSEGNGFTFVANTALFFGRYSIAWAGVALAQAALEEMVTYSLKREQFGEKICKFQLIQQMIANAVTKVHAARCLCMNAGTLRRENNDKATMEINIAKYYSSVIANEVASDALQVLGGNGCWDRYPVERLFRESKVLEIVEGSSQIQQMMIAKYGLRKYRKR